MIDGHEAILGVLVEQGLDILRRFRYGEAEAAPEAEAHSVGLFGHRGLWPVTESGDSLWWSGMAMCGSACLFVRLFWDFSWDDGLSLSLCVRNPEPGEMTMDEVGPNPMYPLQLPTN